MTDPKSVRLPAADTATPPDQQRNYEAPSKLNVEEDAAYRREACARNGAAMHARQDVPTASLPRRDGEVSEVKSVAADTATRPDQPLSVSAGAAATQVRVKQGATVWIQWMNDEPRVVEAQMISPRVSRPDLPLDTLFARIASTLAGLPAVIPCMRCEMGIATPRQVSKQGKPITTLCEDCLKLAGLDSAR